jgi:hypothetical protein
MVKPIIIAIIILGKAFRNSFLEVIKFYNSGLGFYQFQKNLKDGNFEKANIYIVFNLVKNIKETIVKAIKVSPPAFSLSKNSLNSLVAFIDDTCLLIF